MSYFEAKKQEYLEGLANNWVLLQGLFSNVNQNSKEMTRIIFNPKTEEELSLAISTTTLMSDTLNMYEALEDVEKQDFLQEPIVDLYRKTILALRDRNKRLLGVIKEEITQEASPEAVGELIYGFVKLFTFDNAELIEYLANQCGFDIYDPWEGSSFDGFYVQAEKFINKLVPSIEVNSELDLENKEAISFYSRFVSSFHKRYQKEFVKEAKPAEELTSDDFDEGFKL